MIHNLMKKQLIQILKKSKKNNSDNNIISINSKESYIDTDIPAF